MNHRKHGNHAMNHDDRAKKHHHGMIMTMFLYNHGSIMARSWHGSHSSQTLAPIYRENFSQYFDPVYFFGECAQKMI